MLQNKILWKSCDFGISRNSGPMRSSILAVFKLVLRNIFEKKGF